MPSDGPTITLGLGAGFIPDPMTNPAAYRGVAWKRVLAYVVDVIVLGFILVAALMLIFVLKVVTFGLLSPLLVVLYGLIPFCYHTGLLGGPYHATLGMRVFGLRMLSLNGGPDGTPDGSWGPDYLQAAVQTVLFYFSLPFWPIFAVALFNPRRRCVHDFLAGTVIVNRSALAGP